MELGGSTSTLPSGDRAVFLDNELVSAINAPLKCRFNDCFGGIVRN